MPDNQINGVDQPIHGRFNEEISSSALTSSFFSHRLLGDDALAHTLPHSSTFALTGAEGGAALPEAGVE
jgi:hypothetical protein